MHIQIILLLKSLKLFNTCTRFDILLQIASHVLAYTTACINPLYVNIQFIFFFLFSNQNLWHKHSRWKFYFFFSPFIFSACTLFCRRIFVKHSKRYGFFFLRRMRLRVSARSVVYVYYFSYTNHRLTSNLHHNIWRK